MIVSVNLRNASNRTLFAALEKYSAAQPWQLASMRSTPAGMTAYFEWLGDLPAVKEFLNERQVEGIKKHNYSIDVKKWENTIGIKVDDLTDAGDAIRPRLENMAYGMARHPNKLLFTLLAAGGTGLGFDGVAFFSASHPIDDKPGSVNSNLITGAGVDTLAHLTTDWTKVKQGFAALTNRAGDPVFDDLGEIHIFHSPYYQDVFDQLFNAAANTSGIVNPYYKQARTHAVPYLGVGSTSTDWYAMRLDLPVKPFVFVELDPISTKWSDQDEFMKDIVYFGARGRYNVGYGYWQLAQMVNNS